MEEKNFINKSEILKSAALIDEYVRKEEQLLDKITSNLQSGFEGMYSSNNYGNLRSSCYRISGHCNLVVTNNKKISGTFKDITALYEKGAYINAQKLEEIRRNI